MNNSADSKYDILPTNQFRRDLRKAIKRNLDLRELDYVVTELANGRELEKKYKDHNLSGKYSGYRDCHIAPNWILVYRISMEKLVLVLFRTGSHSDLFD